MPATVTSTANCSITVLAMMLPAMSRTASGTRVQEGDLIEVVGERRAGESSERDLFGPGPPPLDRGV